MPYSTNNSEWKSFSCSVFGVDFVSMFYQQNDQEIAVILPNTAYFVYGFCLIYCYKSGGCCVFKG
ncbi:MAG: hypothetical protein HFP76_07105 [Methylococcales symbiont of Iophon sp. n. MRB-2018]|nr:MAG: hypothetical protein HFP76_07105 [Methylococcales symbiont of Iophon sp. n. MRB-2018]